MQHSTTWVILTCPAWIPTWLGHNKWNKIISWLYPPVESNPGAQCPQMWSHTVLWIAGSKCGPCWTIYGGKLGSMTLHFNCGGCQGGNWPQPCPKEAEGHKLRVGMSPVLGSRCLLLLLQEKRSCDQGIQCKGMH